MALASKPYSSPRLAVYALTWVFAVIVLGLTAWRIHETRTNFSFYEPIVAELLSTSIITVLWTPVAFFLVSSSWLAEISGLFTVWVLWLVGAAITTNDFPLDSFRGEGLTDHILTAIISFSWISWTFLSIAGVLALMTFAAEHAHPVESQKIETTTRV